MPAVARATVVWTATMEKGDLSEWTSTTNGTKTLTDGTVRKNIEASGERVYTGNYACKVTVHPDDDFGQYHQDRADLKHDSTLTGEGKDSYLSGYYFLPEDSKTRTEIEFYETKVTSRNWMDLWIAPKTGGGTTVNFGVESNGADLGNVHVWAGDWKAGVWHQVVIHVHWSTDATKGIVDLWFDGQQVVTGYTHKTKFDTNDMFFQTGMHRVLMQPFTETIYLDDLIEADTQADAKIAAPNPTGGGAPDGGTDASGAAGAGGGAAGAGGTGGTGGAGGIGTTGAAGASAAGTAGAAGSASTGAAGATSTGMAGMTSGGAGTSATGGAGTSATGGAGTSATGAAGSHAHSSGGCAYAASDARGDASRLGWWSTVALLGAIVVSRRKR